MNLKKSQILENIFENKVLVVAVHPDDETLGCGGTLLKHKANGDKIHWLICTTLNKKHSYYRNRDKEISKVSKLLVLIAFIVSCWKPLRLINIAW